MFILWEWDKRWNFFIKTTSNRKEKKRKENVVRYLKCLDEVRKELKKYMTNKMNKKTQQ